MPRGKRKTRIKLNDNKSLQGLLQEVYHDACSNIVDAQKTIDELKNSAEPEDVDDLSKIAKERVNALKIKDSAIRIKLEVARLQHDVIKKSGDNEINLAEKNKGKVTLKDFKAIRELIHENANKNSPLNENDE